MFQFIRGRLRHEEYNPSLDPLLIEREEIGKRTERILDRIERDIHPSTGMTLADMAANRKSTWPTSS